MLTGIRAGRQFPESCSSIQLLVAFVTSVLNLTSQRLSPARPHPQAAHPMDCGPAGYLAVIRQESFSGVGTVVGARTGVMNRDWIHVGSWANYAEQNDEGVVC